VSACSNTACSRRVPAVCRRHPRVCCACPSLCCAADHPLCSSGCCLRAAAGCRPYAAAAPASMHTPRRRPTAPAAPTCERRAAQRPRQAAWCAHGRHLRGVHGQRATAVALVGVPVDVLRHASATARATASRSSDIEGAPFKSGAPARRLRARITGAGVHAADWPPQLPLPAPGRCAQACRRLGWSAGDSSAAARASPVPAPIMRPTHTSQHNVRAPSTCPPPVAHTNLNHRLRAKQPLPRDGGRINCAAAPDRWMRPL
jgi:hypothetical protein